MYINYRLQALIFGQAWEPDTMMGKFLAEYINLPSGDIMPDEHYRLKKAEDKFISCLADFLASNGASFK